MYFLKNIIKQSLLYKAYKYFYLMRKFPGLILALDNEVNLADVKNGNISFASGIEIGSRVKISGQVEVGTNTYFTGGGSEINAENCAIHIGQYCSIARNCLILTSTHHINSASSSPKYYDELGLRNCIDLGDVTIGDDVWIGANCVITGGVKIGHGAVVGANSLVNIDLEEHSIYVGSPVRFVRKRKING